MEGKIVWVAIAGAVQRLPEVEVMVFDFGFCFCFVTRIQRALLLDTLHRVLQMVLVIWIVHYEELMVIVAMWILEEKMIWVAVCQMMPRSDDGVEMMISRQIFVFVAEAVLVHEQVGVIVLLATVWVVLAIVSVTFVVLQALPVVVVAVAAAEHGAVFLAVGHNFYAPYHKLFVSASARQLLYIDR